MGTELGMLGVHIVDEYMWHSSECNDIEFEIERAVEAGCMGECIWVMGVVLS